jgi:hypothetical protein
VGEIILTKSRGSISAGSIRPMPICHVLHVMPSRAPASQPRSALFSLHITDLTNSGKIIYGSGAGYEQDLRSSHANPVSSSRSAGHLLCGYRRRVTRFLATPAIFKPWEQEECKLTGETGSDSEGGNQTEFHEPGPGGDKVGDPWTGDNGLCKQPGELQ